MKIQLLGTGGAEGIPALYADSRVSQYARCHGGKDIRTRSAAVVDDDLKIDFGPDTFTQIQRCGLNPRDWSAIVFTHSHDDHFARNELQYSLFPFSELMACPYTIYGNAEIVSRLQEKYPEWPFELILTRSTCTFQHGRYQITPVHAHHKLDEDAHNLLISDGDKTFFYATDTGVWLPDTWTFLSDFQVDGLVIEATDGFKRTDYYGHMDVNECIQTVDRLRSMGVLREGAPVYTTHHGHLGEATHAELEQALAPHGMMPGFDGLIFEI